MKEQVLDSMDIERERGITIKAQTVRLNYKANNGETYVLNLIDTPGHVDFAYEVSRSLAACEGSLLVVDASQGVEAQTLANVYQAHRRQSRDRPGPQQGRPARRRARAYPRADRGCHRHRCQPRPCSISAKTGLGIPDVLEAIVNRLPPPREGDATAPLKALLVDSWYDAYLGVIVLVRIIDGVLKKGQTIRMMGTGAKYPGRARRRVHAEDARRRRAWPRRVRLHHRLDQGSRRHPRRRYHHRGQAPDRVDRCPASSRRSRSCSAAFSPSMRRISKICAPPWASCASTMPASPSRWKAPPRSASASAAASSGCCISKSSRSGWSASSISI